MMTNHRSSSKTKPSSTTFFRFFSVPGRSRAGHFHYFRCSSVSFVLERKTYVSAALVQSELFFPSWSGGFRFFLLPSRA